MAHGRHRAFVFILFSAVMLGESTRHLGQVTKNDVHATNPLRIKYK